MTSYQMLKIVSDALGKKVSCLCEKSIHYSTESLDAQSMESKN